MPEEVTPQGAQPAGAGDKPQGGKGNEEKVSLTRAEFDSLNRQLNETKESERFWANRAKQGGQPADQVDEDEQIETSDLIPEITGDQSIDDAIFNDPDKWAEAISKGPKAIEAFIRKAGFITATEAADIAAKVARRTVDVERTKMGTDAIIVRDFPDLQDNKSELFKATAVELRQLVAMDPDARKRPSTLYAAAKTAKAQLAAAKATAGRKRANEPGADEGDDYERFGDEDRDRDEPEADRRRRADAQDGTRRRSSEGDDDSDTVGPQAKEVIRLMGITEAEFQAESRELRGPSRRGRR